MIDLIKCSDIKWRVLTFCSGLLGKVEPLDTAGYARQDFPGDAPGFGGYLLRADFFVSLSAYQNNLVSAGYVGGALRNVDHDLIHGDSTKQRTALSFNQHLGTLA